MFLCTNLPICSLTTTMLSTLQELKIVSSKWLDYLLRLQDKSNPVTTQFLTDEGYIPSHENPSRVYEPFNEDVSLKRRLVNFENSVAAKPRESERDYQLLIPPIIAINQDAFSRVGSPQRQDSFVHKNPTSPGKRVGSPERPQRHAYSSARSTISRARALTCSCSSKCFYAWHQSWKTSHSSISFAACKTS